MLNKEINLPDGTELLISTIKDTKGKFGRYLAELWISGPDAPDTLTNVSDLLVSRGFAAYKEY